MLQDFGLHPHEVLPDVRGLNHQAGDIPPIVHGGQAAGVVQPEDRGDELGLHLRPRLDVQIGDLDEVIVVRISWETPR